MGKHWANRVIAALSLAVGSLLALTACLPLGIACPAIGYISSVEVQVDGDVAFIDACADAECSPSAEALVVITETEPGVWTVQFHAGPPDEVNLRAYGTEGVLLAQETFELEWVPVGDPGPCPGPVSTAPIELSVP